MASVKALLKTAQHCRKASSPKAEGAWASRDLHHKDHWASALTSLCCLQVQVQHNALQPMLYHTFTSGMAADRLDVMVDSYLFSQPVNESVLNVWFDSAAELAAYTRHRGRRGMKYVRLRDFSIHADKVALLEAVPRSPEVPTMPDKVGLSDKVRMILLLEYGGLWVDADTVFLRDLSPFWPYEFAERWSHHAAHNTAVLRLFAGSKLGKVLWERAFALNETSFYPMQLVKLLRGTGHQLPALPSPVMDPPFLVFEGVAQDAYDVFSFINKGSFFEDQIHALHAGVSPCLDSHLKFFDGAFAYHWSTFWDNQQPAVEGTYFHALKMIMANFVDGKSTNIYGESYRE